ncbi:MAG: apolipoprotein N-acyltransferase [Fimbriimonadaceae bacterium]|nr:apolipoprotein N-acyltransferase [Fimbriimonadaceae bacterium]
MKHLYDYGPAVLSGILLALAFPPANLTFLVFVALVPLLIALRDKKSIRPYWLGVIFGLIFFGAQMFWLFTFVNRWVGNPVMATLPWVLSVLAMAQFSGLAAWLMARAFAINLWWSVPLVWAGIEGFRAFIPVLAFPWGFVGHPLWVAPGLVQMASFGGIFMVSAWVVLGNMIFIFLAFPREGESMDQPGRGRIVLRTIVIFLVLMVLGLARNAFPPETTKRVFVLGQTGVDMAFSDQETRPEKVANAGLSALEVAENVDADLLVLPEGFAGPFRSLPPLTVLGEKPPVPVIFGAIREEGEAAFQSAYAWDGKWQLADKTRLVIFGEYVPLRDQLPFLQAFNLPSGDLTPGKELKTMTVNGMKVGALICFEGVFMELSQQHANQGAQVLVQMSIDDWYRNTQAYEQLWQSSVWRSIESGLPMVRVGSKGQSLTTDSRGRVTNFVRTQGEAPTRVEVEVPNKGSDSFPFRIGFVILCWLACFGVIGLSIRTKGQRRNKLSDSETSDLSQ